MILKVPAMALVDYPARQPLTDTPSHNAYEMDDIHHEDFLCRIMRGGKYRKSMESTKSALHPPFSHKLVFINASRSIEVSKLGK